MLRAWCVYFPAIHVVIFSRIVNGMNLFIQYKSRSFEAAFV